MADAFIACHPVPPFPAANAATAAGSLSSVFATRAAGSTADPAIFAFLYEKKRTRKRRTKQQKESQREDEIMEPAASISRTITIENSSIGSSNNDNDVNQGEGKRKVSTWH